MDGREQNGFQGQGSFGMSSGPSFGSFTFDEKNVKMPEPEPMPAPQPAPQPVAQPEPMPQMPQPQPMPMGQPMPQPMPTGQPMPMPQPAPQPVKAPKGLIIGVALGVFVVLAIVVVAIIMFGQPPAPEPEPEPEPEINYEENVPTLITAKRYCATSGLYVWDLPDEISQRDSVYGVVNCRYNEQNAEETDTDVSIEDLAKEPENDVLALDYYVLKKDYKELDSIKTLQGDYSSLGSELENTDDYKIFYQYNDSNNYVIFSYTVLYKNSYLQMSAKDAAEIETALTTMGFPKSEHEVPTKESEIEKKEKEREQGKATPAKRDVLRRSDMARVGTSLTQYMTNNKSELPGPGMWTATADFAGANACKADNTACNFVMSYLNTTDDKNDFEDPSGDVYNILITGNIADGGEIGNVTFNANSKLTTSNKKYTIGGKAPFYEHVVYIIPGAKCDGTSAKAAKKTEYVVLYRLEEGQTYCLNN